MRPAGAAPDGTLPGNGRDGGILESLKLKKLAEHWIVHNEEHARSYRLWAGRAKEMGCDEPAGILEEIASETMAMNDKLRRILEILDSGGESG